MHGHTLLQVIHTGLLPLNSCHNRFPVPSWSRYYFKNEPLLCYSFLQCTKPRSPPCIVFGTKLHVAKAVDEWITSADRWWHGYWQQIINVLKEKYVPLALCTPQISHVLAWDLCWTAWRGTGFSPTRPTLVSPCHCHSTIAPRSFN